MNNVTIRITAPLRKFTSGADAVELSAQSVAQALNGLCLSHPDLNGRLLDTQGELREFINVFLGKKNIRTLQGLSTPVTHGDVLSIASPFSGG